MKFSLIKRFFAQFGISVLRTATLESIVDRAREGNEWGARIQVELSFFKGLEGFQKAHSHEFFQSQLGQDFLAWMLFGSSGFFVEFGATNGIELSNTHALERKGWKGILVEPSKQWHDQLISNRPDSDICFDCVWIKSNETIDFCDASSQELSTLRHFTRSDSHSRQIVDTYAVNTISLEDLLDQKNAPNFIEFLSIDTEGSEFEILNAYNWEKRTIGFISVEHNYTSNREKIFNLLTSNGYIRVLEEFSKWDDWYIHESLKT